jgi:phytoene dehydrogenase-like protein
MSNQNYDVIVIGAGHNGLTNATYLARSGLKVLLLEKNSWIGGAAVSREIEKGWTYSNCSYVCSLLRPEIFRDLELAKHGLQVVPYGGGVTITSKGDILGSYADHELKRREFARHNAHDGDAYDRYSTEVMRQCKFIRPLLLRTPPDPTSLRPRDIKEMIFLSKEFKKLGEQVIYDTIRFYSMSIADYLGEFFESDLIKAAPVRQRHHRHGAGAVFARYGLRAAASLHGRRGRIDRLVGFRAGRHGRGVQGAGQRVQVLRRRNHHRRRRQTSIGQRQSRHRRGLRERQRVPRENRGVEPRPQAHLHQAFRSEGSQA